MGGYKGIEKKRLKLGSTARYAGLVALASVTLVVCFLALAR